MKRLVNKCRLHRLGIVAVGLASAMGCQNETPRQSNSRVNAPASSLVTVKNHPDHIAAQGRLQPEGGIVRLAALPGDRVESIAVHVGQTVTQGTVLLFLEGERLRTLELEVAQLKLADAKLQQTVKLREGAAAVDSARFRHLAAERQHAQAIASYESLKPQRETLTSLQKQIETLQQLHESPLTRAAVGTLELEAKRAEFTRIKVSQSQAELAAEQAIAASRQALEQAESLLTAAVENNTVLQSNATIAALEKQIELIQLQIQQSKLTAPLNGTVLSILASPGERTAATPLIELADLSQMVCIAEVHEADVAHLAIGNVAELHSTALSQPMFGSVIRIDRSVGGAQLRSPNPLARSDFRSIPVWIKLDPEYVPMAAERLNLQVDVTIRPR